MIILGSHFVVALLVCRVPNILELQSRLELLRHRHLRLSSSHVHLVLLSEMPMFFFLPRPYETAWFSSYPGTRRDNNFTMQWNNPWIGSISTSHCHQNKTLYIDKLSIQSLDTFVLQTKIHWRSKYHYNEVIRLPKKNTVHKQNGRVCRDAYILFSSFLHTISNILKYSPSF